MTTAATSSPAARGVIGGRAANEEDRELLMLLGSVGIRVSEIVTGLFEDSLSYGEQWVFEQQLRELAEGFRRRVVRTPMIVEGCGISREIEVHRKHHRIGGVVQVELATYQDAMLFLCHAGYPVHEHNIGSATADQVADTLTSVILKLRNNPS